MKHLILLLTTVIISLPIHAQLLIAPTRLVLNADQSVTEKIIVENSSDKPIPAGNYSGTIPFEVNYR